MGYSKKNYSKSNKNYSKRSFSSAQVSVKYSSLNPNKYVIIVEKPSVAKQFSKAFNLKGKENIDGVTVYKGNYKGYELYVVPLAGHVLELDFNEGGSWRIPLIPSEDVKFKVSYGKKKFLNVIKRLIGDAYVVFATDFDREGELISFEVYSYLKVPEERHFRMNYSSLQAKELRQSFEKAIKNKQKLNWNLAYAGLLRAFLDKLYGFNYTRLFTLAVKDIAKDNRVWSIGRVQTPTLRKLYERFVEVESFVPNPVLKIHLFGEYYSGKKLPLGKRDEFVSEGVLIPSEHIKKNKPDEWESVVEKFKLALAVLWKLGYVLELNSDGKSYTITPNNLNVDVLIQAVKTKSDAVKKLKLVKVKEKRVLIPVSIENKRESERPPKLYSTTIALSELSKALKMKSPDVMRQLQKMYEMAVISYIRTDSEKFDEKKYDADFHRSRLEEIAKNQPYGAYISKIKEFKPRNRGSKVDDAHPPIHPVSGNISSLNSLQKRIYDLIARRYIASFYPDFVQDKLRVRLKTPIDFSKTYSKIVSAGWKEVIDPKIVVRMKKQGELPNFDRVEYFSPDYASVFFDETNPPEMYSTASIIKKMEELKLGTKSTRAQIIQTLADRGYIKIDSKNTIIVTQKGKELIKLIDSINDENIQLISRVDFTASLEDKMTAVSKGKEDYKKIIRENIEIIKGVNNDKKKKIRKAYLTLS